ncbi:pentapeptide repeat-containing protein [Rothia sp. P3C3.S176]|uniref:pentapeptide repeat-containing protein n=1 Tax=Rothia sp. P3C3.S176 TaxID=2962204 RepID=UPI0020C91FEB|nr:pentapeptide repeat-containing protein [Rothia sp. P3C3.S176]
MPSDNTSSAPENPVIPKAQERPWYIQHFIKLLIGFGLGGGAVAILLPWMLWMLCDMSSGSSDQLRLHLLYITGGIIAVLTLLQTNWKNQGDRLKIDADIKKNEQDAEKNERDHIRQVHAERRSRYTKAVEQLADEKATVRLGGIYTLVGLVDEWLSDDALNSEERQKEGQVIINNLCSYIRSPFPLAIKIEELQADTAPADYIGNFISDQVALREEQDVRRAIFDEMSKRSSTIILDDVGKLLKIIPGTWSDFDVDFSRAPIFYPLNKLTIEKADFISVSFHGDVNFSETTFIQKADFDSVTFEKEANFNYTFFAQEAGFSRVTFGQNADFSYTTFNQDADFSKSVYIQNANFVGVSFIQNSDFIDATFNQNTNFRGTDFKQDAYFSQVIFTQNVDFGCATFSQRATFIGVSFTQNADFSGATFAQDAEFSWTTFVQDADFTRVIFFQDAIFNNTTFTQNADFNQTIFSQIVDFDEAAFIQNVSFNGSTFTKCAWFCKTTFNAKANFLRSTFMHNVDFLDVSFTKCTPIFIDKNKESGEMYQARFATLFTGQETHNFVVYEDSQPIPLGTAELNGVGYHIPVGTVLFDPSSWDEDKQEYTRFSEPAK